MPIYQGNDNYLILEDLYDPLGNSGAGEFIASGTVTAQLYEADGVTTIGGVITLSYYATYDGIAGHYWIGGIEEDVSLTVGDDVRVVVSIAASGDRVASINRRERVLDRTS